MRKYHVDRNHFLFKLSKRATTLEIITKGIINSFVINPDKTPTPNKIKITIKNLKNGKVLLAVIGLSTTTMFMASSMSYDFWVIGFTTLGYSFFISELQNRDKKLEYRNIIMMNIKIFMLWTIPH